MIVAAHAPSYLPWLGYLDRMAKADLFVVLDDLPFESLSFQHRQRIKTAAGTAWLTAPVERADRADPILDKWIEDTGGWQQHTWRTIASCYARAPHFARYAGELRSVYARPWGRLIDLDLELLTLACRWLGIRVPILRSSTLGLEGGRTERLIRLCRRVGARAYLSGSGGSAASLDAEAMVRAGIGVIWQHFDHPVYPQLHPEQGFASHLAFLDLLFHCGDASAELMFPRSHPIHAAAY